MHLVFRRWLLWLAMACAAGIWLGSHVSLRYPALTAGGALAAASAAVLWRRRRAADGASLAAAVILLLAACVFGWGWSGVRRQAGRPDDLAVLMENARESLEVRGRIVGDPVFQPDTRRPGEGAWLFEISAVAVRRMPEWQPASGRVYVRMSGAPSVRPQHAAVWHLAGVLSCRARTGVRQRVHWYPDLEDVPRAAGLDRRGYRPARRFFLAADGAAAVQLTPPPAGSPLNRLYAWRERAADLLGRGLRDHPQVAAVLRALALGLRRELPPEVRARFVATGTFHLFAISGLHMSLLAFGIIFILRIAGVSRVYWFAVVTPVLLAFACMVGLPPSALRGSLMMALWLMAYMVGRRPDGLCAMAGAGLLMLLPFPDQLFEHGFLLSFTVVTGLLVALSPGGLGPAAWPVMPPAAPGGMLRRLAGALMRGVWFCGLVAVMAWLVSMPLLARWYNIWSPLAPLANLPVVPLAALILGLAFMALLGGLLAPGAAALFNWLNILPVTIVARWLAFMQSWSWCQLYVKSPPWPVVWCWYAGLLCLIWRRQPAVRRLAAGILLLAVWPAWNAWSGRGGRVEVLNADGVAVVLGSGRDMGAVWMANTGARYYTRRVEQLLARAGVNRLDLWLAARPDASCLGATAALTAGGRHVAWAGYPAEVGRFRVVHQAREHLAGQGAHMQGLRPGDAGLNGRVKWSIGADGHGADLAPRFDWRFAALELRSAPDTESLSQGDRVWLYIPRVNPDQPVLRIECNRHAFGYAAMCRDGAACLRLPVWQTVVIKTGRDAWRLEWSAAMRRRD